MRIKDNISHIQVGSLGQVGPHVDHQVTPVAVIVIVAIWHYFPLTCINVFLNLLLHSRIH
jgi:hypothetical protein